MNVKSIRVVVLITFFRYCIWNHLLYLNISKQIEASIETLVSGETEVQYGKYQELR